MWIRLDPRTHQTLGVRMPVYPLKGYSITIALTPEQAAAAQMRERNYGRIVNASSISGFGNFGQSNYSATKAGLVGMTRTMAIEWGRYGITVNAICPGYINTEMVQAVPKDGLEKNILPQIPIGRLGEPEEIARCVVFLASDDAGLITGSTLTANGGQYFA